MGIDLRIESESGEVQDEVLDDKNLTERLLPDHDDPASPCLRYVDQDGDTVFNQLQLPVLLQELRPGCGLPAVRTSRATAARW
jgi:hypothetical protein